MTPPSSAINLAGSRVPWSPHRYAAKIMASKYASNSWHNIRLENMKNFHVPLPEQTYTRLRAEAERTQAPATALAREAIEWWLRCLNPAA